jgi:hypothetical protein
LSEQTPQKSAGGYPQHPHGVPPQPFPQYPQQQFPQYPQQQYPPAYYQHQQARTVNGLAIASMVLGIIWIYWIGSILALIFGYIARNQIRERNQSGGGMAIAGIVLGWIGVGTLCLVILLAIIGSASGGSSY